MFINSLFLILLIFSAVFWGWFTRRAWNSRRPAIKWPGMLIGGLLTAVFALVAAMAVLGMIKFLTPKSHPVQDLQVKASAERIERGRHLASAFCVECHSTTADFPMTGGVDAGRDLPLNLGSFISANLTPAGPISQWTDGELFRALRDNVDDRGHRLVFMSATNVRHISDDDMLSLIAFLRSQEPVQKENPNPLDQPSMFAMIMMGANMIPDPLMVEGIVEGPEKAPTAEYGAFLITFLDRTSCHGANLQGGTNPVSPKGRGLGFVKEWRAEEFMATLRTGVDPSGHKLSTVMPWRSTGRLDDVELTALYEYITSLPPAGD